MNKSKTFYVVNSFAEEAFGGNPAAVFPDASGLDTKTMQKIAKQLNLVETVFVKVLKDQKADFEFRYFTPEKELPVAGHPTIASFVALVKANIIDISKKEKYFLKNKKGIQEIIIRDKKEPIVIMEQAKPVFYEIIKDKKTVADIFGIDVKDLSDTLPIQSVDTGLGHIIVPVKSLKVLMKVKRNIKELKEFCQKHNSTEAQLFTFETYKKSMDLHTRNLCPREGIEDPGCGVGNGALGAYLLKHYFINKNNISLKAEQGNIINMPCVIEIYGSKKDQDIKVSIGGKGRLMIKGKFFIN
jgi:trans-2,3-dihydro-3-hydroxyanthranilate isomerase